MMPSAWTAFLMAAENYFHMYGSVEGAMAAFHEGLNAAERLEVRAFLTAAVEGNEMQCRAFTALKNPIVAENSFIPDRNLSGLAEPCLHFHRMALDAFSPN